MPRIFINYRRADSIAYAELICRQLVEQFGADHVFFDLEAIDLGDEFARIIEQRVGSCDVLLAIIGPKWLTLAADAGGRRLDQPHDYVMSTKRAFTDSGREALHQGKQAQYLLSCITG